MIHNYNMILLQYCCPRKCKYFLSVAMYEILDGFTRFLKMCKYKLLASVLHMYTFVIVRVCVYACGICVHTGWMSVVSPHCMRRFQFPQWFPNLNFLHEGFFLLLSICSFFLFYLFCCPWVFSCYLFCCRCCKIDIREESCYLYH